MGLVTTDTAQLKQTLEDELGRLAAGQTESSQAKAAERDPSTPAQEVERAADTATTPRREVAAVIAETAQQTASKTPEGEAAAEAAQEVLAPADAPWGAEL